MRLPHPHTARKIAEICASKDGAWLRRRVTAAAEDLEPNKKHLAQMRILAAALIASAHSSDKFGSVESVAEVLWIISHSDRNS